MRPIGGALGRAAALVALATVAGAGQVTVGSGAAVDLGGGRLDTGEGDLDVVGTLSAGTQGFEARDVNIQTGGVLNGDSAVMQVCGDWSNAGTFNAGTSAVEFVDGCGRTSAVIAGDTTFANLDMTTTSGKLYQFTAGSTQTVTGSLALQGTAGNLLTIRSTAGGSAAFLDVQGSASGDFVDVEDNDATAGNPITLGPNSVTGANTPGWVAGPLVPALGAAGLALLALGLFWSGHRALATRPGNFSRRELKRRWIS